MQIFRVYWLRDNGCHAGTPLKASQLPSFIRERALALAGDSAEVALRLPYTPWAKYREREILAGIQLERHRDTIFAVEPPAMALRSCAARLALTDPAWIEAPGIADPVGFPVWQTVSMTLQRRLRDWISEEYFADIGRFQNWEAAYPMLLYRAARICQGRRRPRGEIAWDVLDPLMARRAMKFTGNGLQSVLAGVERRLQGTALQALARRRYAPIWYEDIMRDVARKPRAFIALLTAESNFINAVVELGANKTPAGVDLFSKVAKSALRRNLHLGMPALEEATRILRLPQPSIAPPQP